MTGGASIDGSDVYIGAVLLLLLTSYRWPISFLVVLALPFLGGWYTQLTDPAHYSPEASGMVFVMTAGITYFTVAPLSLGLVLCGIALRSDKRRDATDGVDRESRD